MTEDRRLISHGLIAQLIKYGLVGVVNTIITAVVIYVLLKLLNQSPYLSNIVGYAAGLISSFLLNSRWTFSTAYSWCRFGIFILIFAVCYLLQLGVLYLLLTYTSIDEYIQQLIAMVFYTLINFVLNKLITFRKSEV